MEHSILLEASSKKNLLAYISKRVFTRWYWQDLFPLKSWPFLSYEALIGSKGTPVAADVVAYDTSAPEKTRRVVSKITGDIPSIRVKRAMSETDINVYNVITAQANPDTQALKDLVFDDVDFVIEAILAQMEILALKLVSSGKVVFEKAGGAGVPTELAVDYNPSHTTGASVIWSASTSTTKPITDIDTIVRAGFLLGVRYKYILMDRQSWTYFRTSDETKDFLIPATMVDILNKRIKATITLELANRVLTDAGYPQIIIVDQSITVETEDHDQITTNPFYAGHIPFIEDFPIGSMLHGPIAEETNPPKQITQAKRGNILVSKWRSVDPTAEWTKGESNVFPTWPLIDRCYFLDTLNASTWTDPT